MKHLITKLEGPNRQQCAIDLLWAARDLRYYVTLMFAAIEYGSLRDVRRFARKAARAGRHYLELSKWLHQARERIQ